jgi:hypothetical protein
MFGSEGQEAKVTRPLYRQAQLPLMLGAGSCLTARLDSTPLAQEAAEQFRLLVINFINVFGAEKADLLFRDKSSGLSCLFLKFRSQFSPPPKMEFRPLPLLQAILHQGLSFR